MEGTKEEFDLIDKYLRKKFTRAFVKSDMVTSEHAFLMNKIKLISQDLDGYASKLISEWIDYSRAWDKGNKGS